MAHCPLAHHHPNQFRHSVDLAEAAEVVDEEEERTLKSLIILAMPLQTQNFRDVLNLQQHPLHKYLLLVRPTLAYPCLYL